MRHELMTGLLPLPATLFALLALSLPLIAGCPGDRPTDETPEGAMTLFLDATKISDRQKAYDLLAPSSQEALRARAARASKQGGRTVGPEEMLATERFVSRWEITDLDSEENGETAVVTASGSEEDQRARITLERVDGHWRVVLPLGDEE